MTESINYKIIGESSQILEINLEPNRSLIADGGALLYLDEEISFETRDDDGLDDLKPADEPEEDSFDALAETDDFEEKTVEGSLLEKLWVATKKTLKKISTKNADKKEEEENLFGEEFPSEFPPEENLPPAESWYITHFINNSEYIRKIAFTTTHSGIIAAIDLNDLLGNELIIQTGTFLCAAYGTQLDKFMDTEFSLNFTKEKFYNLDKVSGDSLVFLQAEGQILQKELENDAIRVNLFSLIAFEATLHIDLNSVQKLQSMRYEDDTFFVLLSGTGRFWLQSANLQQLVYTITPFVYEPPEDSDYSSSEPQLDNFGGEESALPE